MPVGLRVFPNPSEGTFWLENLSEVISSYTIRDISGKLLAQGQLLVGQKLQLDVDLPAQVLLVELAQDGVVYRDRLIVR